MKKIVSNSNNLAPAIISVLWSFFIIFQFFTTIPNLDRTNKVEGSGMFMIGLLLISLIVFIGTLFWIIISNFINKKRFYIDIQFSLMILIVWVIAIIVS